MKITTGLTPEVVSFVAPNRPTPPQRYQTPTEHVDVTLSATLDASKVWITTFYREDEAGRRPVSSHVGEVEPKITSRGVSQTWVNERADLGELDLAHRLDHGHAPRDAVREDITDAGDRSVDLTRVRVRWFEVEL